MKSVVVDNEYDQNPPKLRLQKFSQDNDDFVEEEIDLIEEEDNADPPLHLIWCRPCDRFKKNLSLTKKFQQEFLDIKKEITLTTQLKRSYSEYIPKPSPLGAKAKISAKTRNFSSPSANLTNPFVLPHQSKSHSSFFESASVGIPAVGETPSEVAYIVKFFGFSPSLQSIKPDQSLSCLTFLEGVQARIKESVASMEKTKHLRRKMFKPQALNLAVREHQRITRIFEAILAKIPSEIKYSKEILEELTKNSTWNNEVLDSHYDVLMKLYSCMYWLKPKIKALRKANGIKKSGKFKGGFN